MLVASPAGGAGSAGLPPPPPPLPPQAASMPQISRPSSPRMRVEAGAWRQAGMADAMSARGADGPGQAGAAAGMVCRDRACTRWQGCWQSSPSWCEAVAAGAACLMTGCRSPARKKKGLRCCRLGLMDTAGSSTTEGVCLMLCFHFASERRHRVFQTAQTRQINNETLFKQRLRADAWPVGAARRRLITPSARCPTEPGGRVLYQGARDADAGRG